MKKRSVAISILLSIITLVVCAFSLIFTNYNYTVAEAYKAANLPTDDNVIGNLYKGVGKFDKYNLDKLAQKVGYTTGIDEMVTEVSKASTTATTGVKTAADFGEIVVNFGSYTFNDTKFELTWIPAFVSNTSQGAILTLWLANAQSSNGTLSNQESAYYSAGYDASATGQLYQGSTIYSNSYDGSYIRQYVINGINDYTVWVTSEYVFPEQSTMTKFTQFTTGELASYLVSPVNVNWQKTAAYQKNDPEWNASGVSGSKKNYPSDWLNDKLWLPSVYEVYDSTILSDSIKTSFTEDGGLWATGSSSERNKRANDSQYWLRSGDPTRYTSAYIVSASGNSISTSFGANNRSVRPALHLNLSLAAAKAVYHEHEWQTSGATDANGWQITKQATCTQKGLKERVCVADGCLLTDNKETEEIAINPNAHTLGDPATCTTAQVCTECTKEIVAAKGHDFPSNWLTDENNHWHVCSVCGETDTAVAHTAGSPATCTTAQTCTVCSRELTAALGHEYDTTTWQSDASGHWHECTHSGCSERDSEGTHNPDRAAADCEHGITCTTCAYEMTAKLGHSYSNDVTAPDCENGGYTTHTCANCGDSYVDGNLPANGHTWGAPVWQWAANYLTCKAKFTCSICSKEQTENASVTHDSADASCTVAGETTHTASLTFESTYYSDDKVENGSLLPHAWNLLSETTPPDCVNDGAGEFECTVCHKQETRAIDALGHIEVDDEEIPATCTTDGKTAGKHCSRCSYTLEGLEDIPALGHDFGEWVVTTEATFTEEGLQRRDCSRCDEFEEEVIPKKDIDENEIVIDLAAQFVYGDEIAPVVSAKHGNTVLKWYDTTSGEELTEKPANAGNYKLIARVEENLEDGYTGAEKEVEFTISKREITVTINAGSSEQGADLEELSATITSGSIVGEIPYTLSTNADKETMGEYVITGTCTNDNYEITFVDGVYIVSKKAEDPSGNGEIDLPVDINVEFKVTQSQTTNDYSELGGLKTGYWAQLWYRNDDGTLGDEFLDKINCILTLKIPTDIIEGIRGGEEINREKIAAGLSVYYVNNGNLTKVEAFTIAQKEDESWIVKFNYNEQFRAEVVFNAAGVELPAPEEPEQAGIPWWVWLIVGLVVVAIVGVIIVIIVVAKKKNGGDGSQYDDAELKAQLAEQSEKIDELLGRDDGGFNTPVELDENGNVIFK